MRDLRLPFTFFVCLTGLTANAQPGRGSLPGQGPAPTPTADAPARPADARPAPPAVDNYKQTQHTGKFGGQQIAYKIGRAHV